MSKVFISRKTFALFHTMAIKCLSSEDFNTKFRPLVWLFPPLRSTTVVRPVCQCGAHLHRACQRAVPTFSRARYPLSLTLSFNRRWRMNHDPFPSLSRAFLRGKKKQLQRYCHGFHPCGWRPQGINEGRGCTNTFIKPHRSTRWPGYAVNIFMSNVRSTD